MGNVFDEFSRELDDFRAQYAGAPDREMLRLYLIALEREELVAVGYREEIIRRRLARMPVDDDVRELARHAMLWIWKDEEMHSIYIRGAIRKRANWSLRARAASSEAAGAIGGWSASVRQHARWRDAPASRALATLVTWAGVAAGKVSRDIRAHMDYGPFRAFCLFNIDAENTAWLCWRRLVELADAMDGVPREVVDDFRRIEADEARHTRIFEILVAALDDEDRLVAGETADTLAAKIEEVGEFFLPRSRRAATTRDNPIGSGGRVWVRGEGTAERPAPNDGGELGFESLASLASGASTGDATRAFDTLLDDLELEALLAERARASGKSIGDLRVAIKPTFMMGYNRADLSSIVAPELIAALAARLRRAGVGDVAVVEGPNLYENFFGGRDVRAVAEYFGIASPDFRVVDTSEEQVPHEFARGMAQYAVSRTWKDADFRISFGKMRSHPVEHVSLTVANLDALGPNCEEFIFEERQAQRETAITGLLSDFPPHLALLDAWEHVPDGIVGIIGCPRPRSVHRLYGGRDALAVDCVAARHMRMSDAQQSPILRAACHWFGDPRAAIEVVGTDETIEGWRGPHHSEASSLLALMALPVYERGSGRGALFVPEMDERAFPPLAPPGAMLKLGRGAIRSLLGWRLSRARVAR